MELETMLKASGSVEVEEHIKLRRETLLTVKKMRGKLGVRGDLVDEYILAMFKALSKISVLDAVDEGYQDAATELRDLVIGIHKDHVSVISHPFYNTAKEYISLYPCPSDDIYTDFYCSCLNLEYTDFALKRYMDNRETVVSEALNEANIEEVKARMNEVADPKDLEQLCDLICRHFIIAFPAKIFIQCMTDQRVLCDLQQDNKSRYVFQHMIDAYKE